MRYEEVDDALINMFPEFVIDDIDEGLTVLCCRQLRTLPLRCL
jgi:hypothetical protein